MKAYIKNGLWGKSKGSQKGDLDLRRYIRDVLNNLKVAASDSCCEEFQEGTAPVRFNTELTVTEYYDATDKTWKPTVAAEV